MNDCHISIHNSSMYPKIIERYFKTFFFHIYLVAKIGYIFMWVTITLATSQN